MTEPKKNNNSKFTPLRNLTVYLQKLVENKLWAKVLIAMLLGILAGIFLSPTSGFISEELSITIGNWLALPGKLF